jgi:hypothetical protein
MSHKFHVGQLVEFRPKKGSPISAARGAYEILKQLPERDAELQYRIKSAFEERERIALESELGASQRGASFLGGRCGIFPFSLAHPIAFDARERHGNSTERSTAGAHQRKVCIHVPTRADSGTSTLSLPQHTSATCK